MKKKKNQSKKQSKNKLKRIQQICKKHYILFLSIIILFVLILGLYFLIVNKIIHISLSLNQALDTEAKPRIEKKVFGYSETGKAIEGYEIGNGENSLLLFSAMHGDEMGTAVLLNRLVLEIALNADLLSQTKKLIIIPIVNPDGYYDRIDKLNANGVNLNLNFDTLDWQLYGPEGDFAGPMPFSENESQVMKQIVKQYQPDAIIAFHSYGDLVSPEAGSASIELAKWYADKTGYEYFDGWDYPGTITKWFVETTNKPAITIEISKYHIHNDWEVNKKALIELVSSYFIPMPQ